MGDIALKLLNLISISSKGSDLLLAPTSTLENGFSGTQTIENRNTTELQEQMAHYPQYGDFFFPKVEGFRR